MPPARVLQGLQQCARPCRRYLPRSRRSSPPPGPAIKYSSRLRGSWSGVGRNASHWVLPGIQQLRQRPATAGSSGARAQLGMSGIHLQRSRYNRPSSCSSDIVICTRPRQTGWRSACSNVHREAMAAETQPQARRQGAGGSTEVGQVTRRGRSGEQVVVAGTTGRFHPAAPVKFRCRLQGAGRRGLRARQSSAQKY